MNTRLKQFLSAENISQAQFADTIKVVRASVSHVLAGRNKPGYDFIRAIMLAYPRLNMEWLMIGKGKMYKDADSAEELSPVQNTPTSPHSGIEDSPSLFDYEDFPGGPLVSEMDSPTQEEPFKLITNASHNEQQPFVNQRKVTKVLLFFDDGTYQELQ